MTYLSHIASFHSNERIAPSNRGIKHLASSAQRPGYTTGIGRLEAISALLAGAAILGAVGSVGIAFAAAAVPAVVALVAITALRGRLLSHHAATTAA